ncbi:hypothetical protein F5J12DRAFT_892620 [Pisolithus orientalis]|uniref:uncharacterized protein n=1 Tax=Pisolithus orientalis TaxID=936130 RepID=UPI002225365F|nr:uncharacterized protein F5J12DRAFT_892620 [Pisolithus orientalis]KAI6007751.1 hypothetical protein F5J12DRAFT_892620 [Pisolithus orientalis]
MSYYAPNYAPGYGTGGYAAGGPPPVPGADPALWARFNSVDTNRNGAITATELQSALANADFTPFDLDTIKLLMNFFVEALNRLIKDHDRDGMIGFEEFQRLSRYIKARTIDWQNVFRHFDRDRSGTIDGSELRNALSRFGYNLSPRLLQLVQKKYATATNPDYRGIIPTGISFDRFVRACVVVKQLTETFQRLDIDNDGWIQIDYDQFMATVLSLP